MAMKQLNIKVEEEVLSTLDEFCEKRGENKSTLIRRLIYQELARHSYLEDRKKALGVTNVEKE